MTEQYHSNAPDVLTGRQKKSLAARNVEWLRQQREKPLKLPPLPTITKRDFRDFRGKPLTVRVIKRTQNPAPAASRTR